MTGAHSLPWRMQAQIMWEGWRRHRRVRRHLLRLPDVQVRPALPPFSPPLAPLPAPVRMSPPRIVRDPTVPLTPALRAEFREWESQMAVLIGDARAWLASL